MVLQIQITCPGNIHLGLQAGAVLVQHPGDQRRSGRADCGCRWRQRSTLRRTGQHALLAGEKLLHQREVRLQSLLARVKQALYAATDNTLEEQLAVESRLQGECGKTRDFKEGVVAFMEKRPAVYEGR